MTALALLLVAPLCAALPPDRDVTPQVTALAPENVTLVSLLPRAGGGFYSIIRDDRAVGGDFTGYRGTVLTAALDPVSPTGVPTPIPMSERFAAAVHDGSGVVAVWAELASTGASMTLYASRFDESGVVLVPRTQLAVCPLGVLVVALAHDGGRTVVAWGEASATGLDTVRAAAMTTGGQVSGPWTLGSGPLMSLTAASSSGTTLVAWVSSASPANTLQGVKIPAGAAPAVGAPLLLQSSAELVRVAATGTTAGAWHFALASSPTASTQAIRVAPLAAAGTQLGTAVTVDSFSASYSQVWVAFTGSELRVVWTSSLGASARVVPLTGAPTVAIQPSKSSSSSLGLACAGAACAVGWSASPPTSNPQEVYVSRLGATAALLDVPGKELFFPADDQAAPAVLPSGTELAFVINRTVGRAPPEVLLRRLSAQGQWAAATQSLATNQAVWASATSASGHVVLAARSNDYSDAAAYAYVMAPGGGITMPAWPSYNTPPEQLRLACAATRCGLLRGDSFSYTGRVFDNAGAFLSSSAITIPLLSNNEQVHLAAAGSSFLVVVSTNLQPIRAAVTSEGAFPTFGAAFPLTSGAMTATFDFKSASQGNKVAVVWAEQNSCRVWGRLVDVSTATAQGPGAVQLYSCPTERAYVRSVTAKVGGGFTVLFEDTGYRVSGVRTRYSDVYRQELDATFTPVGVPLLVTSTVLPLAGIALTQFGGKELFSYARWDEAQGVLSWRAKVTGLDDAGIADAGVPDAGTFDAGTFDAGTFDAGTFDAGTFDGGTFDGGTFDAGTADAGALDAGLPVTEPLDAGAAPTDGPAAVGCGCQSLTVFAPWLLVLLLARTRR